MIQIISVNMLVELLSTKTGYIHPIINTTFIKQFYHIKLTLPNNTNMPHEMVHNYFTILRAFSDFTLYFS